MKPVDFIEKVEGDDSRKLPGGLFGATWDPYGKCWNIGPGLTHGITKTTLMTKEQIDAALQVELSGIEVAVDKLVKVPLGENQRTALISFAYNIGVAGFAHSSVLRVLNEGHYDQVPAHLALFNKAKGVLVRGLVNRRNQEIALWNHPDDHPVPPIKGEFVPKADDLRAQATAVASAEVSPATSLVG